MRSLSRPPVSCGRCDAKIYFDRMGPTEHDPDVVISKRPEPPEVKEKCPRCDADVDTRSAYAAIPGFPPKFDDLRSAYADFVPSGNTPAICLNEQ